MFFFQAEDGIRDLVRSRGLGDVYKRQPVTPGTDIIEDVNIAKEKAAEIGYPILIKARSGLSLIHI